jgi:hypothetical protein
MDGHLTLDEKAASCHLLWLRQAHRCKDGWCNITQDTISLLQTPALGCVGHDKWDLISGVGSLRLAICKLHLFGISAYVLGYMC